MLHKSSELESQVARDGEEVMSTGAHVEARTDPRIVRSRHLIEQAFMQLLRQIGFEAITVRDIAKRAGVNRATFYAHFEDKYALFTYAMDRGLTEIIEERLPHRASFTAQNVRLLILALIEFFERSNDIGCTATRNQLLRPLIASRVQEKLAQVLLEWLRATPDLYLRATPDLTATMISWMVFGLGMVQMRSGTQEIDHNEISQAVELIMQGAFPAKPLQSPLPPLAKPQMSHNTLYHQLHSATTP